MTIGCLGWGSLTWNPGDLPVRGPWFQDGPLLPLEFARQSKNGSLTLVVVPGYATRVRSLWALLAVASPPAAREALGRREDVPEKNQDKHIGMWVAGAAAPEPCPEMPAWATDRGLDAVVWTALPPKFGNDERVPPIEEAMQYLRQLPYVAGQNAENYVRKAPRQVDTPYRRVFEAELGWAATSER